MRGICISIQALQKAAEVRQYIETNLLQEESLSASALARRFAMSESLLRNSFLHCYNVPLHTFVIRKRMEHALSLLSTGELAIKEISLTLGYNDLSNFSRDFKLRYGVSPQAYRKLVQYRVNTRL